MSSGVIPVIHAALPLADLAVARHSAQQAAGHHFNFGERSAHAILAQHQVSWFVRSDGIGKLCHCHSLRHRGNSPHSRDHETHW